MKCIVKSLRTWIVCIAIAALVALPAAAQAQFADKIRSGVTQTNQELGYSETPLSVIIGNIIRTLISAVGVVLLLLLIYAGFLWMTAGGDMDKVKKARGMIFNALIGMVIIVLAYAITDFVIQQLAGATSGGASGPTPAQ